MKKLTRNQKIYIGVLVVAMIALTCDQLLFSPGKASATETAAFHPSASPAARAQVTGNRIPDLLASVRQPKNTLASQLTRVARDESLDVENVEDAMRAPAEWFPTGDTAPVVVVDPVESDQWAREFRDKHQLNAVMANTDGGYAIVNKRPLRVGQQLAGFTLTEVRARSAVFERAGVSVELSLPVSE